MKVSIASSASLHTWFLKRAKVSQSEQTVLDSKGWSGRAGLGVLGVSVMLVSSLL